MGNLKRLFRKICYWFAAPLVRMQGLGNILEVFYQEYNVHKIIYTQQKVLKKLTKVLLEPKVKYGPFQGLKYPSLEGFGSELFPKLLGCYELELFDILDRIKGNDYDKIINIGCAEGYYAVGLGRMFPKAKIYAYDLAERARTLCREMGDLNELGARLQVFSICTTNTLKRLNFEKRALIVCDCEGYELDLFQESVIVNLENCDVLIELHDFINPTISEKMLPLFKKTHQLEIFRSIDDDLKLIHLNKDFEELAQLSDYEKKIALGELRPTTMEWAFLTPKKVISRKVPLRKEIRV